MQILRTSCEEEMILEFLKAEINSDRFNEKLYNSLKKLKIEKSLIINGNLNSTQENNLRLKIMKEYRGYPDTDLFENFPKNIKWHFVKFDENDLDKIFYIDYDYWNLLSKNTSKPKEAAYNIKNGVEIFGVSNKQYFEGVKYLTNNQFPPVILITCNNQKYLIIEGHLRMTVYGMEPNKFLNTYGFVGYCSKDEMKKYDNRMI